MKTTPPTPLSRATRDTEPLYRTWLQFFARFWLRYWLNYRLDGYTRSLHTIAAQRENDFQAERLLHREISATRSRLQSL